LPSGGGRRVFRLICSGGAPQAGAVEHAQSLSDLAAPPGNRLEALKGDRAGMHSIRINDQWRVVFRWREDGPAEVEIVDYH
jgi:proteic killer suppression protein